MAALSVASTLKVSAMQEVATSNDSRSSWPTEPSVAEVLRKSMMARARRLRVSGEDALVIC